MTIYADILVLTNLYLDFFLLWCVEKWLQLRVKGRRMVLGAAVGGFCSLFALAPVSRLVLLFFGLFSALITTLAAFAPLRPLLLAKAVLAFWLFSFLLAGFFLFLLAFLPIRGLAVLGNAVYFDISPLFLLAATCVAYLLFWLLQRLFPKPLPQRYCQIFVEQSGRKVSLFCKADTGCALREPFSGLPVIVGEVNALRPVASPAALSFLEKGSANGILRLVPFETVGGKGILPAFQPEKVTLAKTGTPLDCYIALYGKSLSAGQFNGLFNPDLFSEEIDFTFKGGPL